MAIFDSFELTADNLYKDEVPSPTEPSTPDGVAAPPIGLPAATAPKPQARGAAVKSEAFGPPALKLTVSPDEFNELKDAYVNHDFALVRGRGAHAVVVNGDDQLNNAVNDALVAYVRRVNPSARIVDVDGWNPATGVGEAKISLAALRRSRAVTATKPVADVVVGNDSNNHVKK